MNNHENIAVIEDISQWFLCSLHPVSTVLVCTVPLNTSCFKFVPACMPVKLENGSLKGLTLERNRLIFSNTQYLFLSGIDYLLII